MKNKLERFVDEHRDEFDSYEPRPDLWQDIQNKMHPPKPAKTVWLTSIWRYAAAIIIMLTLGFGVYELGKKAQRAETAAQLQQIPLQQIAPELAQVESYYTSLINQKKQQLNDKELQALGLGNEFDSELAGLDSAYTKLKKDLYTDLNKEKIVDAMIYNLQLRMEIINQQLNTLQRIRQHKGSKHHENVNI